MQIVNCYCYEQKHIYYTKIHFIFVSIKHNIPYSYAYILLYTTSIVDVNIFFIFTVKYRGLFIVG